MFLLMRGTTSGPPSHHHDEPHVHDAVELANVSKLAVKHIFQTSVHSGQAGRICDVVEERERHHHCRESNH